MDHHLVDKKDPDLFYRKARLAFGLAFSFCIAVGCSNYSSVSLKMEIENQNPTPFLKEKYTEINPFQDNRYSHRQIFGDTILVGFNPFKRTNQIDFIHLFDTTYSFKLEFLPDNFSIYPSSFYVHSLDSIFLLNARSKMVMISNSSGDLLSKISLDLPELYNYELIEFLPLKPIWSKKGLLINIRPIGLLEDSEYLRDPQFMIIRPSTSEVQLFGSMDIIADYLGSGEVNTDFYSPYYEVVDEYLYVMYPFYPYIFKIDLDSPNYETEKFKLGSAIIEETTAPTSKNIHSNQFENSSYRSKSVTFSDLHFHGGVNLFTVVMMHPYESTDENGRLRSWGKRKSSLLVLDENLKILSEFNFDNGQLLLNSTIPFSSSLRIANSIENEKIKDSLHYYMDFDLSGLLQKGK